MIYEHGISLIEKFSGKSPAISTYLYVVKTTYDLSVEEGFLEMVEYCSKEGNVEQISSSYSLKVNNKIFTLAQKKDELCSLFTYLSEQSLTMERIAIDEDGEKVTIDETYLQDAENKMMNIVDKNIKVNLENIFKYFYYYVYFDFKIGGVLNNTFYSAKKLGYLSDKEGYLNKCFSLYPRKVFNFFNEYPNFEAFLFNTCKFKINISQDEKDTVSCSDIKDGGVLHDNRPRAIDPDYEELAEEFEMDEEL